jgi:hypothetical protein
MGGVEAGADDFLPKPLYVQEVVARARALLQRRERERLETVAQGNAPFAGELADIPLVDLLRAIEANRKSGVAHLTAPEGTRGELFFRQGAVVDAEVGRLSGREAVYRLFAWGAGRFEIEWKSIRRKDAVEMEPAALLMEALRRHEQWRQLLAEGPALDTVFEVDYRLLAERLAEIPDEVNGILRLFDGVRSFIQVIDDCGLGDLEALAVIGKLYRERIVRDVKGEGALDAAAGADMDGWLGDAVGPFRAAPERARRDLFGSGAEAGVGVHRRATAPVDPLEEGREGLADDMRARFTDRLNAEPAPPEAAARPAANGSGPQAGARASTQPAAGPPPVAAPARAPVLASETTLQGVGIGMLPHPRPSTSPGFAATVLPPLPGLPPPDVTPPMRASAAPAAAAPAAAVPAPVPAGGGDGIPEPVTVTEGEPAIVIPFPSQETEGGPPAGPASGEEPRAVAGEIVARKPLIKPKGGRRTADALISLPEETEPPVRSTEPGLGPAAAPVDVDISEETEPPIRSAAAHAAHVESASDHAEPTVEESAAPVAAAPAQDLSEPEAADQIVRRRRFVGPLVGLAVALAVAGAGWWRLSSPGKGGETPGAAHSEAITATPAVAAPAAAPSTAPPAAAAMAPAPAAAAAAAPAPPPSAPTTEAAAHAETGAHPGAGAAPHGGRRGAAAALADGASNDLDERASDPKLARAAPTEFPQLLAACRASFNDKRMKDAEAACAAAKDANPDSAEAYALMAHALFNRNHRREALSWAERAVKIDPNQADAYVIIGGVHQDAGEKAQARAAYQKYLDLAPDGAYAADLRAIVNSL